MARRKPPARTSAKRAAKPAPPRDGCRDCGPFFLDVVGPFARRHVVITWTRHKRPTAAAVEVLIDAAWTKALELTRKTHTSLYDGKLCRLIGYAADGKTLRLTTGPVSFREFLGTNAANPQVVHTAGPEVLANPLGVSAAVVSADGFVVLGRRSERVALHGGKIHPIGGMVEMTRAGRPQNPFQAIGAEFREETGIAAPGGKAVVCLGMVRDKSLLQPELVFRIQAPVDMQTLRDSAKRLDHNHEHTELLAVRDQPTSVVGFIEKYGAEATPVALATLLLHGQNRWGSGWFATARGYLRKLL